jgi:hypothetical protein
MSAFKNLPPHVVRELKRHVSPQPLSRRQDILIKERLEASEKRSKLRYVVAGTLLLTGTAATFPLLAHYWIGGLNERDEALTPAQVRRGAFLNTGTRYVGKNPDWDFQTHEYKKDSGYFAILQEEKKNTQTLPGEYLAASQKDLDKHEAKIEAFAKGKIRPSEVN